ncbi:ZNF432 [Branchiostoma lanceolatum]|uniref:ZNF432 protein n=1 Tax=Branchiostoma lanceolatum TaxID=7740 RepID=A0A8K0F3J7_BRALA|nr:ZNF432 [Branchiostoma lanceolatum]
MMVCGLSREVTLAVLPRLYVEELILELGRRNIHPVTDSSSREDLISLLCDVMIEEYSRGRRAACANLQREHSTTMTAVTRPGQEGRNTTPAPPISTKRSASCVERERRGSGQKDGSFGKQTMSSGENARSLPVQKTPPAEEDTADVIVVEDDEPEPGRQEDAPSTGAPTGAAVHTPQHSSPQPSPVQRGRHTSSKGPSACKTPDSLSSTGVQRVLSPHENNTGPDNCVQRNSRGKESPGEATCTVVTTQEIRVVEEGATVQPDSSRNVGSSTSQPEEGQRTKGLINMETNNYTKGGSGPSIVSDSTQVQETSGIETDVPEVIIDTSNNPTSPNTGHKDTGTTSTGVARQVESLAVYSQEFFNSDSERPPGYLQTLPGVSPPLSNPAFQASDAVGTTTMSCPVLLEALGTEGSLSNDSLLGTQQPTCTVTTSEEAMAIWQNLSKRSQTTESDSPAKSRRKSTDNSRHVCQECGYKAPSNSALVIHMRKHTGEKPFGCDVCGYRSAYKTALVAHMATHNGNKPFMCGECGYRTVQKRLLAKHMKTHIHTEQKFFHCEDCGYKTTEESYLQIHTCKSKEPQDTEATAQE